MPLQSAAAVPSLALFLLWRLHKVLGMPTESVPLTANYSISSELCCLQLILLFMQQPLGSHWDPTRISSGLALLPVALS